MSEIFMAKRGVLSNQCKADLRKAKIVVVEVDAMDDAKFIRSNAEVEGSEMLRAAMKALNSHSGSSSSSQRENFCTYMAELIEARA